MNIKNKLSKTFYKQDAVSIAQQLLGKVLVRKFEDNTIQRFEITATEAYLGMEDKACHASKGRTKRTEIMFSEGGVAYVYLIYGIHWLFNVVTGFAEHPQAVLICGLDNIKGSGRVGKLLQIDKSFYGEDFTTSQRIWIEDNNTIPKYKSLKRVGIDYAGEEWKNKLWRFESDTLK